MPEPLEIILAVVLILAVATWIGGYIAVVVVSVVSAKTLEPEARVAFFRRFGAAYLKVAGPALLVALALGWMFLSRLPWSDELARMVVASGALVLLLIAGIVQARDLTRLRERLSDAPDDGVLAQRIRVRARTAGILRGLIGVLTLGIIVHAAILLVELL